MSNKLLSLLLLLLLLSFPLYSNSYQFNVNNRISLNEYLSSSLSKSSTITKTTSSSLLTLITSIAKGSIEISNILRNLPFYNLDVNINNNNNNNINASGEEQKKLDILSNDIMKKILYENVKYIISEEDALVTECNLSSNLIVAIDPLDGSSNIDCNIPVGTIFGVFLIDDNNNNILDSTNNIIASGYVLYSSSTELVITTGDGTHQFTYYPVNENYYLTKENIIIPKRGIYYSLNEGRSSDWPIELQTYINNIKIGNGQWEGQRYSSRYVCSMVADLHRTLLYGGWAANPRSHLRLLYEAKPLSFLVENAKGKSTDGVQRLLDIQAKSYHDRTPLFMGSSEDIDELLTYGDVRQKGNIKY